MKYNADGIYVIIVIIALLLVLAVLLITFNIIMFARVFEAIEELKQLL